VRTTIAIAVLGAPACAIKLTDRNSPIPNGGVTGASADCSKTTPEGHATISTGAAEPVYVGRYVFDAAAKTATFDWSGNYIRARFQGSEVKVSLEPLSDGTAAGKSTVYDDKNNPIGAPTDIPGTANEPFPPKPMIFIAVVDDQPPIKFTVDPQPKTYVVATGLDASRPHEVTIHRESEPVAGRIVFHGFDFGSGTPLPPTERPRKIEIIGDSITCGYGDEGANATCPFDIPYDPNNPDGERIPVSENEYLAYGSLAARALDADVSTICFSGKGVYQNYTNAGAVEGPTGKKPIDDNDPVKRDRVTNLATVPERITPSKESQIPYYLRTTAHPDGPPWDFAKDPDQPQVVIVNIGTNDFARDNNQDSIADGIDLPYFKDQYKRFITDVVRKNRPGAHIFLALPPMVTDKFPLDNARSNFRSTLQQIANELNAAGDPKVYFIELVEMGTRYGLGCDYHPNLEVHRIMAQQVAGAITTKTCWDAKAIP
jgi:lysophospholipase L1-like esterase